MRDLNGNMRKTDKKKICYRKTGKGGSRCRFSF